MQGFGILRLPPRSLQPTRRADPPAPFDSDDAIVPPSLEHLTIDARRPKEALNHPLLDKTEFRVPVSSTLSDGDDSSVLHIDCGCGPGTASWAVMNVLSDSARVTTIGDHSAHMIGLADAMTAHVAQAMTKTCHAEFCQDWDGFARRVAVHCEHRWRLVIVTANSLFSQDAMQAANIHAIGELIIGIRQRTRESPVFLAGTHARYLEEHVNNAWDDIASRTGAHKLYGDLLENIVSGSPRRYDAPTWVPWQPPAQLAHLFRLASAGEAP